MWLVKCLAGVNNPLLLFRPQLDWLRGHLQEQQQRMRRRFPGNTLHAPFQFLVKQMGPASREHG